MCSPLSGAPFAPHISSAPFKGPRRALMTVRPSVNGSPSGGENVHEDLGGSGSLWLGG